ncbi:MAG: hypothetical protein OEU46_23100 [Alphaproteobacteria bacterium]|nr:hypothetical protein [Alphaproteobacteria bacterium]
MGLSKKELEETSKKFPSGRYLKVLGFVLGPIVWLLFKIGFIKRRLDRSIGGRIGTISRYTKKGMHDKAIAHAFDALNEYRDNPGGNRMPSGGDFWWFFMSLATKSLRQCDDQSKWDEAIELAKASRNPPEDYYAAQSYLAFSHWKYAMEDYDAAIEFAEVASRADSSWGEPDFVLGWYRLVLGGGDAMHHLTEAVRKDSRIFFRIASDPKCRQYPHIIQKLKELSAEYVVAGDGRPIDVESDSASA